MTIEYDQLAPNKANFVALTPLSFLQRTADIYPDYTSLIYNSRCYTWAQTRRRCSRIAASLTARGLGRNDTVSVFAFNTPEMFEAHFAIPMSGAVINTINTRLDAATVSYILDHSESKLVMVDRQLWPVLKVALKSCQSQPEIVFIDDADANEKPDFPSDQTFTHYEDLVVKANDTFIWQPPEDEWQALALNYTSGTTGRPKGVVYHHRGSYLMSMGSAISWALPQHPRYLYTVPMFHCNGWGHAWTMTAMAGTVICMRAFSPKLLFELLEQHQVSHFGGAPIILNRLANAPAAEQKTFDRTIRVITAGAPPSATVLEKMTRFGFDVMHVYGLTETFGHILQSAPQQSWSACSPEQQAGLKARQGVRFAMTEAVDVICADGKTVAWDGESIGEIVIRGNTTMKGYLKDPQATEEAFRNGWFASGDLAVIHPDGYIQIKDRAKDIIVSGGENISSIEIEAVLYQHDLVAEAAVVSLADEEWGEVPCAFVELKPGQSLSAESLIAFCGNRLARFKRPKKIVFGVLPKTATGKIQKNILRETIKELQTQSLL